MAAKPVRVVAAACDGACSGNPGPGGWGALLRFEDGSVQEMGGADRATTNNRMELTAALALLETIKELPRPAQLSIRTDSRYLIDGFSKWIMGWKRKGWRTASGGAVLNRDLWEQLDQARLEGVSLVHVKGHSGDPDNDRCDAIAVAFSKGQMPAMAAGDVIATARIEADEPSLDLAPAPLQQLLSRCELADRFAGKGYGLSLVELAQLVDQPLQQLERRSGPWRWRDWQVLPLDGGRWRLQRDEGGLGARE
ncbi:MAG: ribonuclease HI [Cyanobacteria bacterium]|nr:ribonuclease HI [Cyanobacteriota bacterium]MDA1247387.1 ribonuclease HI [Cyanobacteriota bacterium]